MATRGCPASIAPIVVPHAGSVPAGFPESLQGAGNSRGVDFEMAAAWVGFSVEGFEPEPKPGKPGFGSCTFTLPARCSSSCDSTTVGSRRPSEVRSTAAGAKTKPGWVAGLDGFRLFLFGVGARQWTTARHGCGCQVSTYFVELNRFWISAQFTAFHQAAMYSARRFWYLR